MAHVATLLNAPWRLHYPGYTIAGMKYVALLRGINVGGKARVEMPRLKQAIERAGFTGVATYINSGNVILTAPEQTGQRLAATIEAVIEKEFGFRVPVVVRDAANIAAVCRQIPAAWVNDPVVMRTDVMFLWEKYNSPDALSYFNVRDDLERLIYTNGALVWNINREHAARGSVIKMIGSDIYRHMTIRNVNTVRKLAALMGVLEP